jgi:hypothetical protein
MLVKMTELRGELDIHVCAAKVEAALAADAASKAEAAAQRARAEAEELAFKRLDAGEVAAPGGLLDQFRLHRERAKAETERANTLKALEATTKRFTKFKADRACSPMHHTLS